jgi:hypothetical protein
VARIAWMQALPGVSVANAETVERLPAWPEADAGGVWIGVEIADQHHLRVLVADALLDEPGRRNGLQYALVLIVQLPVREMIDEEQWAD